MKRYISLACLVLCLMLTLSACNILPALLSRLTKTPRATEAPVATTAPTVTATHAPKPTAAAATTAATGGSKTDATGGKTEATGGNTEATGSGKAEAMLADTQWRAEYYVTQDEYGSIQQDTADYWTVELFLFGNGAALLYNDHFDEPITQELSWTAGDGIVRLKDPVRGEIYEGELIDLGYEQRMVLRLNAYGEYNMMQVPYLTPQERMQALAGSWEQVSGVTEGWIWSVEETGKDATLQLSIDNGTMYMLYTCAYLDDAQITSPLTFMEARGGGTWYMESEEFTYPGETSATQMQITLLDDGTLMVDQLSTLFDDIPYGSRQFYWREGAEVDEAAMDAAVAEIVAETAPEDVFVLWNQPDFPHVLCYPWLDTKQTPSIIICTAPELTVSLWEGEPIYAEGSIVGWADDYSVTEPVTLQRGEYLYLGLGYPWYDGQEPFQYIELIIDGEAYFWSLEDAAYLAPNEWVSIS